MYHPQYPESPVWEPEGYFDEATAYNAERPENPSQDTGSYTRDLQALTEEYQDGRLRSTTEGNPNDFQIFTKDESEYCLTVDRLVWIDGWRSTSGSQKSREAMTLLVLNLAFGNKTRKKKIAHVLAEVVFLSKDFEDENPTVVAWGPFHHQDRWNATTAESKTSSKAGVQLAAGIPGPEISLSGERGSEMTNQVIDFDQGSANRFVSAPKNRRKRGDKPNAVQWWLKQNDLQKQGVNPELKIAVLVSRPNPMQPYRVSFRLEADTGTKENVRNIFQKMSRRTIGDQINWLTDPNELKISHGQGVFIAESVDRENLGSLIKDPSDSENLEQLWLKPRKGTDLAQLVQASQSGAQVGSTDGSLTRGDEAEAPGADVHLEHFSASAKGCPTEESNEPRDPVHLVAASTEPEAVDVGRAPPTSTSGNLRQSMQDSAKSSAQARNQEDTNCHCQLGYTRLLEYDRLLGLETRAAQAEARLASQDQIIFHLQKEITVLQKTISGNVSRA